MSDLMRGSLTGSLLPCGVGSRITSTYLVRATTSKPQLTSIGRSLSRSGCRSTILMLRIPPQHIHFVTACTKQVSMIVSCSLKSPTTCSQSTHPTMKRHCVGGASTSYSRPRGRHGRPAGAPLGLSVACRRRKLPPWTTRQSEPQGRDATWGRHGEGRTEGAQTPLAPTARQSEPSRQQPNQSFRRGTIAPR